MHWLKTGERLPDPSLDEQYAVIVEQYEAMLDAYGAEIGVNCARKHIGWYTKGLHGSAEFRNAFNQEARPGARQGDAARFLRALAEQGGRLSGSRRSRCADEPSAILCSLCHIVVLGPQCERRNRDPCRVPAPRWRRRLSVMRCGAAGSCRSVEIATSVALLAVVAISYFIVTGRAIPKRR